MPAELRCLIFGYAIGQQHDYDVIHLDNDNSTSRFLKHVRCTNRGDDEGFRHVKCWQIIRRRRNSIRNPDPGLLSLLLTCRRM